MNILFLLKPKNSVSYIRDDDTLRQGLENMRHHGFTASPVLNNEGVYLGTVNEGDFLWHMLETEKSSMKELEQELVRDIIRENWNPPVTITATVEDLLERVLNQNFVPVVDDRNLFVGIITRSAVIKHLGAEVVKLREKKEM